MPRCIYCLEEKDRSLFNREHVVPQAFGRFKGAPTLARPRRNRVCAACNHRLGRHLDVGLARGSWEAVLRLQRGVVPLAELANLQYDRLTLSLPADHHNAPMLLRFVAAPDGKQLGTAPLPQLRLSIDDGPLQCIPEARIEEELPKILAQGKPTRVEMFCWTGDAGAFERLTSKAKAHGLAYHSWKPISEGAVPGPEEIEARMQLTIDSIIARSIAKIAFEYFIWCVEPIAARLIRDDLLDPIRRLVYDDAGDWRRIVQPTNDAILVNETRRVRTTQGHILALRWHTSPGAPVVVWVSLFNDHAYRVRVCEAPALIWQAIDCGHHFSLSTHECTKLAAGRFISPPPRFY